MKKILFVGGGEFQIDGIKKAREAGFYTIVADGNPNASGKEVANEFYHVNILNKEEVLKIAISLKIDGVASIASEVTMESMSYVASKMGLPGFKYDLIGIAHDKKRYYEKFSEAGIPIPKTYLYKDNNSISELINDHIFIIKPSKGSGSRGVKKTKNISEFNFSEYIKENLNKDEEVLLQEFIEGKELTVDGFVIDKKFNLLAISEEMNDNSKGHTFSSELIFPPQWINESHVNEITRICNKVVNALGIEDNGPMHLELIFDKNNKFNIIDFSLRGGGFDLFTKIIQKTSGVDVLALYLNSVVGNSISMPVVNGFKPVSLSFSYPEKTGVLKQIIGSELEGAYSNYYLKFLSKIGQTVFMPEGGRHRIAYFICWGNDMKSVLEKREEIRQSLEFIVD